MEKTSLELMVVAGQRQDLKKNIMSLAVVVFFVVFPDFRMMDECFLSIPQMYGEMGRKLKPRVFSNVRWKRHL